MFQQRNHPNYWRFNEQIKLDKGYAIQINNLVEDHSFDAAISLSLHHEGMRSRELKKESITEWRMWHLNAIQWLEGKYWWIKDMTSKWNPMIRRKDSIHKISISNLHHKESSHTQATRICLTEMNEDNAYKMRTWSKGYQLSKQDTRS